MQPLVSNSGERTFTTAHMMFVAQVSVVGWGRNVAGSSRRKHVAIERLDKHRRQCVFRGDLFRGLGGFMSFSGFSQVDPRSRGGLKLSEEHRTLQCRDPHALIEDERVE